MLRRLPLLLGLAAALIVLLLAGPVAVAVALIRSSPEPRGPDLPAHQIVAILVLAAAALAGIAAWGLARLVARLVRRGG